MECNNSSFFGVGSYPSYKLSREDEIESQINKDCFDEPRIPTTEKPGEAKVLPLTGQDTEEAPSFSFSKDTPTNVAAIKRFEDIDLDSLLELTCENKLTRNGSEHYQYEMERLVRYVYKSQASPSDFKTFCEIQPFHKLPLKLNNKRQRKDIIEEKACIVPSLILFLQSPPKWLTSQTLNFILDLIPDVSRLYLGKVGSIRKLDLDVATLPLQSEFYIENKEKFSHFFYQLKECGLEEFYLPVAPMSIYDFVHNQTVQDEIKDDLRFLDFFNQTLRVIVSKEAGKYYTESIKDILTMLSIMLFEREIDPGSCNFLSKYSPASTKLYKILHTVDYSKGELESFINVLRYRYFVFNPSQQNAGLNSKNYNCLMNQVELPEELFPDMQFYISRYKLANKDATVKEIIEHFRQRNLDFTLPPPSIELNNYFMLHQMPDFKAITQYSLKDVLPIIFTGMFDKTFCQKSDGHTSTYTFALGLSEFVCELNTHDILAYLLNAACCLDPARFDSIKLFEMMIQQGVYVDKTRFSLNFSFTVTQGFVLGNWKVQDEITILDLLHLIQSYYQNIESSCTNELIGNSRTMKIGFLNFISTICKRKSNAPKNIKYSNFIQQLRETFSDNPSTPLNGTYKFFADNAELWMPCPQKEEVNAITFMVHEILTAETIPPEGKKDFLTALAGIIPVDASWYNQYLMFQSIDISNLTRADILEVYEKTLERSLQLTNQSQRIIICALVVSHVYSEVLEGKDDKTILNGYQFPTLSLSSNWSSLRRFKGQDRVYFLADQFLDFCAVEYRCLTSRRQLQNCVPISWAIKLAAYQFEIKDRYEKIMVFLKSDRGEHQLRFANIIEANSSGESKADKILYLAHEILISLDVVEKMGPTSFFAKMIPEAIYIPFWFFALHLFQENYVDVSFFSQLSRSPFKADLDAWFLGFTPYSLAAKQGVLSTLFPLKRLSEPAELQLLLNDIKTIRHQESLSEKDDLESLSLYEVYHKLEPSYQPAFAMFVTEFVKAVTLQFNDKENRLSLFESLKTHQGRWVMDWMQVKMDEVDKTWTKIWLGKDNERLLRRADLRPTLLYKIRDRIFKEIVHLYNVVNYRGDAVNQWLYYPKILNEVSQGNEKRLVDECEAFSDATTDEVLIQALLDIKLSSIRDCLLSSMRSRPETQALFEEGDYQIGCILESFGEGRFQIHFSHLYFSKDGHLNRIGDGADEAIKWIPVEDSLNPANSVELDYDGLISMISAFEKNGFKDELTGKRIILLTLAGSRSEVNTFSKESVSKKRKRSPSKLGGVFITQRIQNMAETLSSKNESQSKKRESTHFSTFNFLEPKSEGADLNGDFWEKWTLQLYTKITQKNQKQGSFQFRRELFGYGSELIEKVMHVEKLVQSSKYRTHGFFLDDESFNLKGYQKETVRKILAAREAGLNGYLAALDMGLGKTAIAVEVMLQKYVEKGGQNVKTVFVCTKSTLVQSANAMKKMLSGMILDLLKKRYLEVIRRSSQKQRDFQMQKVLYCAQRNIHCVEGVDPSLHQKWKDFAGEVEEANGWTGMNNPYKPESYSVLKFSKANEVCKDDILLDLDLAKQIVVCDERKKMSKLPSGAFVFAKWGVITAAKGSKDLLSAISQHPWDIVIVDEAQEINNFETSHYQLIKKYQEQVGAFCLLLSGTPVENEFTELSTLLSLIGNFQDACRGVAEMISEASAYLINNGAESGESPIAIIQAYAQMHGLRKVLAGVTSVLTMKSTAVHEDWNGMVPTVNKLAIQKLPNNQQAQLIKQIENSVDFRQMTGQRSFFKQIEQIKTILLHPQFAGKTQAEQDNFIDELKYLSLEGTKEWMRKSEKLIPFLPDQEIGNVLKQKEPVMVFVDRITAGNLLSILLRTIYKDIKVNFLNGDTPDGTRQKYISEFNKACDESVSPHVLICSIGAGNAGIDCPKGKHLVLFEGNFNPMVEKQAYSRIVRIGNDAIKNIYKLDCDTVIENRVATLAKKKRLLIKTLFAEEFTFSKFLKYLLYEIEETAENIPVLMETIQSACEEDAVEQALEGADPFLNFSRKKGRESSASASSSASSEEFSSGEEASRLERLSGKEEIDDNETQEKRKNPFTEASLQKRARVLTQPVVDQKPSSNSIKLNLAYWQGEAQSLSINGEQFDLLPIRADNSFSRSICAGICLSKKQPIQLPKSYKKSDFFHAHTSLTTLAKANKPLVDLLSSLQNEWAVLNPKQVEKYCLDRKIQIDIFNINGEIKETRGAQSGEKSLKLLELVNPKTNDTHYDLLIKSG